MTLEFTVNGAEIRAQERRLASGGAGTARARFSFDGAWEGYAKTAVFFRDAQRPVRIPLERDEAPIPDALLAEPGLLYAGVFGTREGKTATSALTAVEVLRGAAERALPLPPETSVYAALAEAVQRTREESEALAASLLRETAAFEERLSAGEEKRKKSEALREQAEAERAAAFGERRVVSRERFDALVRALEERLGIRVRFERTAEGGCLCLTEEKKEGERI